MKKHTLLVLFAILVCMGLYLYSKGLHGFSSYQSMSPEAEHALERKHMVQEQLKGRDITHLAVLAAMEKVPRHKFIPEHYQHLAYTDGPLPIGQSQTISQPYIVAIMTQLLDPKPDDKILEIGTGSGYQAAVLSEIVDKVYTIEIVPELYHKSTPLLHDLGYDNVVTHLGDGREGWWEHAPYDGIIVTAAPEEVPQHLVDQLKIGGKLIIPVGHYFQDLMVITKTDHGLEQKAIIPVRFVPMTEQKNTQ